MKLILDQLQLKAYATNAWYGSRKYRSSWYLTMLVTAVFVFGAIASNMGWISGLLLSSSEWLTFLGGLWSAYFASNVASKYTAKEPLDIDMAVATEDEPTEPGVKRPEGKL